MKNSFLSFEKLKYSEMSQIVVEEKAEFISDFIRTELIELCIDEGGGDLSSSSANDDVTENFSLPCKCKESCSDPTTRREEVSPWTYCWL